MSLRLPILFRVVVISWIQFWVQSLCLGTKLFTFSNSSCLREKHDISEKNGSSFSLSDDKASQMLTIDQTRILWKYSSLCCFKLLLLLLLLLALLTVLLFLLLLPVLEASLSSSYLLEKATSTAASSTFFVRNLASLEVLLKELY